MLTPQEHGAVREMQEAHEALRTGSKSADDVRAIHHSLSKAHSEDRYEAIKWALACHEGNNS